METKEQKQFIENMCNAVKHELQSKIESGKVPENWNGFELRWWLRDTFKNECSHGDSAYNGKSKRKRDYVNDVIINNL